MKLPDANVLLYALDATSARHAGAKAWLDETLSGSEEVGFARPADHSRPRLASPRLVLASVALLLLASNRAAGLSAVSRCGILAAWLTTLHGTGPSTTR